MNERVSFNMVIPASEAERLRRSLIRRGAELVSDTYQYVPSPDEPGLLDRAAIDPFRMIMGQSPLNKLILGLIEQSGRLQHGGIKINATGNQVSIIEDPDIEKGTIVVATLNGFKFYTPATRRDVAHNMLHDLTLYG